MKLHPNAAASLNDRAEQLFMQLQTIPEDLIRRPTPSNPNIHSVFTFSKENIIGGMEYGWSDFTGNVTGKAFEQGDQTLGLFGGDYTQLLRVAEDLHKGIRPTGICSDKRIVDLVFDWLKQKKGGLSGVQMADYVLAECDKRIKETEIWIPISQFYIQAPLAFGRLSFRAITKVMMDEWEASVLAKTKTPEEADAVRTGIERKRQKFQGLAASIINLAADPDRAYEIAYDETERTVSLLRFFSPAILHPRKISYSAPLGSQHSDSFTYLLVNDRKICGFHSGLTDRSRSYWNLTQEDLQT